MTDDLAVTRAQAIERVRKLQAVTMQRGATEFEAAAAAQRAARLIARFGLQPSPASARVSTQRYATAAWTDRRSSRSLRFVAFG